MYRVEWRADLLSVLLVFDIQLLEVLELDGVEGG